MSIIFDLFEPSRRHREEERNRLEWTRDEEGLGDPHRGPIDLDSGVVKVKAPDEDQDDVSPELTPSESRESNDSRAPDDPVTAEEPDSETDHQPQNRTVTKPAAP